MSILAGRSPSAEPRQIRSIAPEDEQGLLDLWRETWTNTYRSSLGTESLRTMLASLDRGAASMLAGHGERGYAIVQGRQIIGSAIAAERGEVAYLWGMYVRPAQQRSGAGSRLLAAVARDLDPSADVEVRVLATSRQARDFYRTRGFRAIGEERTEITDGVHAPALVLRAPVARLLAKLG